MSEIALTNVKQLAEKTGLTVQNAEELLQAYGMPINEAGEILASYEKIKVTAEDQTDLMAEARAKRLKLKDIRVAIKKRHDEIKEDVKKRGDAIDYVERTARLMIEPAEAYLKLQEEFAQLAQEKRKAEVTAERTATLLKYVQDETELAIYNYADMADDAFEMLEEQLKDAYEARESRRVAAEKAEADRLAEEQRIATEKAEKDRKERILAEKKAKAEREKRKIAEDAAAAERAKTEKAEAEAKALRDAETKRIADKEASDEKERQAKIAAEKKEAEIEARKAAAPDKEKLLQAVDLLGLGDAFSLNTDEAIKLRTRINAHLEASKAQYIKLIEEL